MIDEFSWAAAYPEIFLLVMACSITLFDLAHKDSFRNTTYFFTLLTLGSFAILHAHSATNGHTISGWGGMIVSDPFGSWLKFFSALAVMAGVIYGRSYAIERGMLRGGELFTLNLFALLGMCIMISGHNFLLIYLGLELLALSAYTLVALNRYNIYAIEAAIKYFVLGVLASGFLLYGISMLYGATGSLNLIEVVGVITREDTDLKGSPQILILGLVFIVSGLAFKLGVVPFHMWVPDVYQGAPTAITLLIGGAPKLAAFAILVRILVEGLQPLAASWQHMLIILSVMSLFVGNFAAVAQKNIKRMLAFSAIAQMGFMLLGMVSGLEGKDTQNMTNAYSSSMFYMIIYVLNTIGVFGIILLLSRKGFESEDINDLAGLNQRSPLYAGVMTICMLSLAGIPPLIGFYAKFSVLQALMASGNSLYLGLSVFAVLMSLVGAFYYLRIIKIMYFDPPLQTEEIIGSSEMKLLLVVNGALILILGFMPGGIITLCEDAVAPFFNISLRIYS